MENNVGLILTKRALLSPQKQAYVDADSGASYTFAELNQRSNQTANMLREAGVSPGTRVGVLMMNSVEFTEIYFAAAKVGGVVVPLNWRLVADELEFILADSGVEVVLFGKEFEQQVTELHGRGDKTAVKSWYSVGAATTADFALDYDTSRLASSADEPPTGARDDDLCYIMYTSGTTGLPKGAVHTHNSCLWALFTFNATADYQQKDRYLLLLPMFHVGALTPLMGNLYLGITSVVARSFDPVQTWQLIDREKITIMLAVPAMLNFMWQVPNFANADYSRLRWIMCGASPVPVSLIDNYNSKGIEIQQVYGLTETCGPACLLTGDDAMHRPGSTGKAFFHTDARIVDENMQEVAVDVPGEVIVRGKHLMREYWNRPEATAETLVDGWLKTGDIATRDADGFIYIMDRTKDMLISGGENVYPAEIENIILSHPKISEVAVIGQPSTKWGESPLAVVVRSDPSLSEADVIQHCEGKLAGYKMPKAAVFIDEIPRNPSGKVLKRLLREQFPGPAD